MNNTTFTPPMIKHVEIGEYTYVTNNDGETFWRGCQRCGGSGHYMYDGSDSRCYLCFNSYPDRLGKFIGDRAAAEKHSANRTKARQKREAKREEIRLASLAKRDAAWAALEAAHPAVYALLQNALQDGPVYDEGGQWTGEARRTERDSFVLSLAQQMWSLDERIYTEKQIAALQRIVEKRAERKAEADAHPVVAGRGELIGEILSAKFVDNDFGGAYKIVLKDDRGFRVYGSLAKSLVDEFYNRFYENGRDRHLDGHAVWVGSTKGSRIKFVATVEASKDDVSFGFFSRPTKAEVLSFSDAEV